VSIKIQQLLVDRGSLLRVVDLDVEFLRSSMVLEFQLGRTLLVAANKDDSLVMTDLDTFGDSELDLDPAQLDELSSLIGSYQEASASELALPPKMDLSAFQPWSNVVGALPVWAWSLTNNLGYPDGVQVEFVVAERKRIWIQLVVCASQLDIHTFGE
jgi:Family of unknown function (DUF6334)